MSKLSSMADSMTGSEIVRLGNEISARIRNGEKIYNYTIGDFDSRIFPIPALLEQLIIDAYREHYTNYPAADGVLELRQAVAAFIKDRQGLEYGVNEIQIASGGRPLIYAVFKTVVNEGDKVIYAIPSWNNNHYTHLNQAQHVMVATTPQNNFMPLAADIAPHLSGAALLCLCTPQNPTGTTLPKEELEKICQLVVEENNRRGAGDKKLYIMFDQMYGTLTFGSTVHYNPVSLLPAVRPYTIFVDGISKVFAATGVRVGWSLGPAPVIAKMKAFLTHIGAWAPMAEQHATARFLLQTEAIDEYLQQFKHEIETRLRLIYEGLMALKEEGYEVDAIAPQAAIYLTIRLGLVGKTTPQGRVLYTQSEVTDYILSEAKLAVVPFYAFGADTQSPWYRLSVGTCKEEEIAGMLHMLRQALAQLV